MRGKFGFRRGLLVVFSFAFLFVLLLSLVSAGDMVDKCPVGSDGKACWVDNVDSTHRILILNRVFAILQAALFSLSVETARLINQIQKVFGRNVTWGIKMELLEADARVIAKLC